MRRPSDQRKEYTHIKVTKATHEHLRALSEKWDYYMADTINMLVVWSAQFETFDQFCAAVEAASKKESEMKEYEVKVREVEADYEQDPGWEVVVFRPGLPPHSSEFFTDKKEAQKRARELRKSLP